MELTSRQHGDATGYIFDLDGTIYLGDRLIPGAAEAIATLRSRGDRVVFLTNKPLDSRATYAQKLTHLGIPTDVTDVINSSVVMADYLHRELPGARVYCIGEPPLLQKLHDAGMTLVADPRIDGADVDFVVASFDRSFDYEKLDCALQAILKGARLVATNADRTCPVDGGVIPDCGGIIAAIEAVSGQQVEVVVGKPNPMIARTALRLLDLPAERCVMVGDRLETDILMGNETGMTTVLVLTGVSTRADADAALATRADTETEGESSTTYSGGVPDFVVDSIVNVPAVS